MTYEHLSPAAIERADWLVVLRGDETLEEAQFLGQEAASNGRPATDNPFDEETHPDHHEMWAIWHAHTMDTDDDNEDREPGC